ncbi:MAG TPA: lactonase family protein [Bryobacteraceae bacterium]|nr:lactonase family protein [Bryobacteraceae bacterium]
MKVLPLLALVFAPVLSAQIVYVGAYTNPGGAKGINAFRFDAATGKLSSLGLMAETTSPSFVAIAPNGKFLYAVNETDTFQGQKGGAVSAFSIDRATGKLTFLNQVASKGAAPCHIVIDPTGKAALVANYNSGDFASFPIHADGKIGEAASVMQDTGSGPNRARQAEPHAHEMFIAGQLVLGADLGTDHIQLFHLDAPKAVLTPADPPFFATAPGFGPRHMVLSHDKKFLFVLSEMKAEVETMAFDPAKGPVKILSTASGLPADFKGQNNTAAEIMLNAKGTTLYTSNRGHNSIAVFAVDTKTGALKLTANVPSGGKTPRYFTLDPTGKFMLVCNQDSNNIVIYKVDPNTGALTATGDTVQTGAPVDLAFLK